MSKDSPKTLPKKPSIVDGLTRFVDIRKIREELKKDPHHEEYKSEEIKVHGHIPPPLPVDSSSGFQFPWALSFSFLLGALFPTIYFLSTQKVETVIKVVEKEVRVREVVVEKSSDNPFHPNRFGENATEVVAPEQPLSAYVNEGGFPDDTPDPHVDDSYRAPASEAGEEPQFDM